MHGLTRILLLKEVTIESKYYVVISVFRNYYISYGFGNVINLYVCRYAYKSFVENDCKNREIPKILLTCDII